MNGEDYPFDLIVLAADRTIQYAIEALLNRPYAFAIRSIRTKCYTHPHHDPGCLSRADDFLRPFINQFAFAVVVFDREGCGKDQKTRCELENEVETNLFRSGWENRASAIVIDPELENWVFSDSPEVDRAIGWLNQNQPLRAWLEEKNFLEAGQTKPLHPKEALEAALRHVRQPRSSALYAQLAKSVGLGRCTDKAFLKFVSIICSWFPDEG